MTRSCGCFARFGVLAFVWAGCVLCEGMAAGACSAVFLAVLTVCPDWRLGVGGRRNGGSGRAIINVWMTCGADDTGAPGSPLAGEVVVGAAA